ncbi:Zinc finger CCCH domain-containing protein 48 [Linum grandiflorum]
MVFKSNVFERIGVSGQKNTGIVCRFWRQGKCTHQPCRFLHGESPSASPSPAPYSSHRRSLVYVRGGSQSSSQQPRSNVYVRESRLKLPPSTPVDSRQRDSLKHLTVQKPNIVADEIVLVTAKDDQKKSEETICGEWKLGTCFKGDKCRFSHSWCRGDGFSMLVTLPGHGSSPVAGLSFASGVSQLYCASIDGVLQAWDSNSGQVSGSIDVGGKIGCMITEGDWLYVGMESMVKVWNIHSGAMHTLAGPVGQVHALDLDLDFTVVFAAAQDGIIWVWKTGSDEQGNVFQPAASLIGHTSAVISLRFGAGRLYSGSIDGTIKMWDITTSECIQTFKGHDDAVTSLLCYDAFLLSCSLDKKIKVWASGKEGRLEVVYTHEEAHGALALSGIKSSCGKAMLLCSWKNGTVGMYELPSFVEKGRMYSKGEVRGLGAGSEWKGMFFTGDASGVVNVWKLAEEEAQDGSSRQK